MSDPSQVSFEPPAPAVSRAVATALEEDLLPLGDLTASLIGTEVTGQAAFVARHDGVLAGTACARQAALQVGGLEAHFSKGDGERLEAGEAFGTLQGSYRSLLTAERTALNFLCHLSGIASLTARYVEAAKRANPDCQVWDTRKTTPGLRALEKAAVRAGGGVNHRGNLSEGVLIKDNHLGAASIKEAVALAKRRFPGRMVEVECDRLDQVEEALSAGASLVLCDNMSPAQVKEAVGLVRAHPLGRAGAVLVEASGGIDLETIGAYAAAGADLVSVGALTHSAPVLDIGLDLSADFGLSGVE